MSEQPPSDTTGTPPSAGQNPGQYPGHYPGHYLGHYPGQYPYPMAIAPPATSKATTAMVLGITGLVVCPGVLSIPAWVLGRQAVREIDASQGQLGGRSQAQAGFILGIIGTIYGSLMILAVIGFFVLTIVLAATVDDGFVDACLTDQTATSFEVYCE